MREMILFPASAEFVLCEMVALGYDVELRLRPVPTGENRRGRVMIDKDSDELVASEMRKKFLREVCP